MTRIFVIVGFCFVFMVLGMLTRGMYNKYRASSGISDEARREHYLMPQKDSPAWKDWTAKYGDTADSWCLFTIGFHTKYLSELNKRLTLLEKAQDTNEPNAVSKG